MRRLIRFGLVLAAVTMPLSGFAQGPSTSTTVKLPPAPLLPQKFAGWVRSADVPVTQVNGALAQEFGLKKQEAATYKNGSRMATVSADQYVDSTGAYSAYTLAVRPGMKVPGEKLGRDAAETGTKVLFWSNGTLVTANFSSSSATDVKDLAELAVGLPKLSGPSGRKPDLPRYFPKAGLEADGMKYSVGEASYKAEGGVIPAPAIDFTKSPEIVMAHYGGTASGNGLMTLIYYPTPQIAAMQQKAIEQWFASSGQTSTSVAHTGPIVSIATGGFTAEQARKLTGAIHYETTVTWNKTVGYISEASKAGRLMVGIITLSFFIAGAGAILGLFFGGGRALLRVLQGKPASTMHEVEFIHLDLVGAPILKRDTSGEVEPKV